MTDLLAGAGDGPPSPELDAATVVLLRDAPAGLQCLMLRKTQAQSFGGLWVFPGGRVEEGDGAGLEGARRAAVREAAEETGLAIEAGELVPLAHWTPPESAPRRYRTWFFVAPLPHGADDVVVDGAEIGDHVWTRPADALASHRRQEIELLPPTWVTLWTLSDHGDAAEALSAAAANPVERYATRFVVTDERVPVAMWEGDVAYRAPSIDLAAPGPRHRLTMDPAGWRYERSAAGIDTAPEAPAAEAAGAPDRPDPAGTA